ncbi:unnamed protein product [Rangifer tarandus platyrhynchus]|uniref:Uncharacterized protein n=1 Tax=Rangifer tarandus platyrhynchus TaxID=3082113 RepID=A0ABN8Z9Z0_RANTA|nr:unnamed protein product [Rangifer tarandus platyrhynchus]
MSALVSSGYGNSTGGLSDRTWPSHSSVGWESKIEVLAGLLPPEQGGEAAPGPPPAAGCLLGILGVPWVVEARLSPFPHLHVMSSECLCVCVFMQANRSLFKGMLLFIWLCHI